MAGYPSLDFQTWNGTKPLRANSERLPHRRWLRNQKRPRNPLIQRSQNRPIGLRQLQQMSVRRLRWRFYPSGKSGDVDVIRKEGKWLSCICLHSKKKGPGLRDFKAIHRHACNHANKADLGHRRRQERRTALRPYPVHDSLMELMLRDTKGDERIHIHKVSHGKSASSSLTISLVRIGASGPRSMAMNPVTGS